jgi:hypothetical protein
MIFLSGACLEWVSVNILVCSADVIQCRARGTFTCLFVEQRGVIGEFDTGETATLSPDEVFALLGNETRFAILRTLAAAEGPVSFTDLRNWVGIRQGGQFNYHLDKVVGHFVDKDEAGYVLRQTGKRVVEAVLSGTLTEDPVLEPTVVESWPCPYCGAPCEIRFREEHVARRCTSCPGLYGQRDTGGRWPGDLGALHLPPAGIAGRDAQTVLESAFTWSYAEWLVAAKGVCPRCSARVDHTLLVCEEHADGEVCDACGRRKAVGFRSACKNCDTTLESVLSMHLAASPEVLAFLTTHGVDPLTDSWDWGWDYEEGVVSTDPFEGRFRFTVDGDELTLTVDEDLEVVSAVTE